MKKFLISVLILTATFILPVIFSEALENLWVNMRVSLFEQIKQGAMNGEDTFWLQFKKLILDKYFGIATACVFNFLIMVVGLIANIGPMFAAFGLMKATK